MKVNESNWDAIPVSTGSIARPVAGAQFANVTVPAGHRWFFMGCGFPFTSDANVADRYAQILIKQNGSIADGGTSSSTPITASKTTQWVLFGPGSGTGGAMGSGLVQTIGIGNGFECKAGCVITVNILNIQVGDRPDSACLYYYKDSPA